MKRDPSWAGRIQATEHRTELAAIITDLHMPHMDGLGFVRALRRMLPNIPVVVASGRLEDGQANQRGSIGGGVEDSFGAEEITRL